MQFNQQLTFNGYSWYCEYLDIIASKFNPILNNRIVQIMNIGHLYGFNSYPPEHGGGIHNYNLVLNLTQLGCKIHTFNYEKNPQCITYPITNEGIQNFLDNVDVLYIRIDGGSLAGNKLKIQCMEQSGDKPIIWEINSTAEEMLSKFKFKSLLNNIPEPNLLNKLRQEGNDFFTQLKMQRQVNREERYRREYAKMVDAAICVSDSLKDYAVNGLGIQKGEVIPNGSEPTLFSPEKKDDNLFQAYKDYFKVIYAGDSRWPWQGFDLLTGVIEKASRQEHKILFIVLNNGLEDSIKTGDNVLVFNNVNYTDVPPYLASADACLCLYHDFPWSKYGFHLSSLKLFDYMASGKPVIASRLGQLATVIEDGKDGLLTKNDVNDIYEKILFCFKHQEQAVQIGVSARKKVVDFYNWERVAKSTLDVIKSVSNSKEVAGLPKN